MKRRLTVAGILLSFFAIHNPGEVLRQPRIDCPARDCMVDSLHDLLRHAKGHLPIILS